MLFFSFKIPGPARVLLPILPILCMEANSRQNNNHPREKKKTRVDYIYMYKLLYTVQTFVVTEMKWKTSAHIEFFRYRNKQHTIVSDKQCNKK